jgi:chemotaxis protein methyltransferase CheR
MIVALDTTPLTHENFGFVRELVHREAAIVLEAGKEYLVETRLASIATRNRFASVNALVDHLRFSPGAAHGLHHEVVEALTTNETLFFRDLNPFDALRQHVIPEFKATNPGGTLNVWSAACSTGQEAYSIAMLLAEHFPEVNARLLGTDLSPAVVTRARSGLYQQIEVNRGLPAKFLVKYFRQSCAGWQICAEIKQRVEFRTMNLVKPWPLLPRAHVVMLRNVMIYFDLETRRRILREVKRILAPGGYLVLGAAETTLNLDPSFTPATLGHATFFRLN